MIIHRREKVKKHHGGSSINNIINKLPFELNLPGYQYCEPGTKLAKRLKRGDPGKNPLDAACKEHDIAYSKNRENIEARNAADRTLADKAWQRVFSVDSSFGEKVTAIIVTNIMNAKSQHGMVLRKKNKKKLNKRVVLRKIVDAADKSIIPSNSAQVSIKAAEESAREAVKKAGGRRQVRAPRILPLPSKIGGVLPLTSHPNEYAIINFHGRNGPGTHGDIQKE